MASVNIPEGRDAVALLSIAGQALGRSLAQQCLDELVPKVGFEPTRGCPQRFLRPSRLPFRHFGIKGDEHLQVEFYTRGCKGYNRESDYGMKMGWESLMMRVSRSSPSLKYRGREKRCWWVSPS